MTRPKVREPLPEEKPYYKYVDAITLPDAMTIGDMLPLVDVIQGIGAATWSNTTVSFEFRAFNEWELRDLLAQFEQIVEDYIPQYFHYEPNYENVSLVTPDES